MELASTCRRAHTGLAILLRSPGGTEGSNPLPSSEESHKLDHSDNFDRDCSGATRFSGISPRATRPIFSAMSLMHEARPGPPEQPSYSTARPGRAAGLRPHGHNV